MEKVSPFADGGYSIEEVVGCSWTNGEVRAILNVVNPSNEAGMTGTYVLKCDFAELLTVVEEGTADRGDLLVIENTQPVFQGLSGLYFSMQSKTLNRLKDGENFGEYINHESRHFIVRAPYNCFEFFSAAKVSLGAYDAH